MGDSRTLASLHSNFFSSLKQVEKRLKLEHSSQNSTLSQSPLPESSKLLAEESLSSPLFLYSNQQNNNNNGSSSTIQDNSEPPEAFLSCSPQLTPTQQNPPQAIALDHPETIKETESNAVDDIEQLIQLLGLSSCEERDEGKAGLDDGDSCHCEGGFYDKIVGAKGPKCGKEVERLEGWIDYFLNGGGEGRIEPFRLVHLLLGKAALVSEGADHNFGGFKFPSTIREFFLRDPPTRG